MVAGRIDAAVRCELAGGFIVSVRVEVCPTAGRRGIPSRRAFETNPLSELLGAYEWQGTQLQNVLEQFTTPWLHAEATMRSIAGMAELHGISKVLENATGFDEAVAAVLRVDLGDWRDQISWPSAIFSDPQARVNLYKELGFNHELTAFPAETFHEGLGIIGLRRDPPPLSALYGTPVPVETDDEREEAFVRTNAAHDWLQRLESQVRAFIDERMTVCFGPDWPRRRLPNGMYDQWRDKKRAARKAGAADRSLISYADFTDYITVICRRDNWREVFETYFRRPESVRESFQRLYPSASIPCTRDPSRRTTNFSCSSRHGAS